MRGALPPTTWHVNQMERARRGLAPKGATMTISVTCKRCREVITADDEDDLLAQVQTHARDQR